jgi:chromosome segregation ATPase
LSQVEEKLVGTERRNSDAELRYSDAERCFTENYEHHQNDHEYLQKNFEATSATLREKLATIAELETSLANLTAENLRLVQQNATDADALEDLKAKSVLLDMELEQKDNEISDLTNRLQSFEKLQVEKLELEGKLSEATKLYVKLEIDKNKIIKETSGNLNSALSDSQQRETTISELKTEITEWKAKFGSSE